MKIDRLLSIIVILLNQDNVTAKELADRFEVSIRTVLRFPVSLDKKHL